MVKDNSTQVIRFYPLKILWIKKYSGYRSKQRSALRTLIGVARNFQATKWSYNSTLKTLWKSHKITRTSCSWGLFGQTFSCRIQNLNTFSTMRAKRRWLLTFHSNYHPTKQEHLLQPYLLLFNKSVWQSSWSLWLSRSLRKRWSLQYGFTTALCRLRFF